MKNSLKQSILDLLLLDDAAAVAKILAKNKEIRFSKRLERGVEFFIRYGTTRTAGREILYYLVGRQISELDILEAAHEFNSEAAI